MPLRFALMLGLAALQAVAPAADRLIGLLTLPQVFGSGPCTTFVPRTIELYERPGATSPAASLRVETPVVLHGDGGCSEAVVRLYRTGRPAEQLPTLEHAYEAPAAIVVERSRDWFRVRTSDGPLWLHAAADNSFFALDALLTDRLTYMTAAWDRALFAEPGGRIIAAGSLSTNSIVSVLASRTYGFIPAAVDRANPCTIIDRLSIGGRMNRLCACIIMLASPGIAIGQTVAADPLVKENATVKLAAHSYVIPDNSVTLVPNVGIVVGTRATLVIDPGLGRRNGEAVLREVNKISRNTEVYVAATHFHAEHTTGYMAFPAAKYIASTIQAAEFAEGGTQQIKAFAARSPLTAELLKDAVERKPDVTFDRDYLLDLGGVRVHMVVVGPTHTRGDTGFFVEGDRVLFSGDVVMNRSFLAAGPVSSLRAWLTAFDRFEAFGPTTIVPAHGPVGDAQLIPLHRGIMRDIQARVAALKVQKHSADDAAAAVQKELQAKYPDWGRANGILAAARSAYAELP